MSKSFDQIPDEDRPREKLLRKGAPALSDQELLAVLLGKGTPGMDVMTLAGKLARVIDGTRMSSKGQVVIPEDVRNRLGLRAGVQFVVVAGSDVVILKTIEQPSMAEFGSLIQTARRQARSSGMKRSDIARAIARVRGRKGRLPRSM